MSSGPRPIGSTGRRGRARVHGGSRAPPPCPCSQPPATCPRPTWVGPTAPAAACASQTAHGDRAEALDTRSWTAAGPEEQWGHGAVSRAPRPPCDSLFSTGRSLFASTFLLLVVTAVWGRVRGAVDWEELPGRAGGLRGGLVHPGLPPVPAPRPRAAETQVPCWGRRDAVCLSYLSWTLSLTVCAFSALSSV